ncbi:MAG: hypothetical protein IJY91_03865 [Oscillospiraceae bacterium]|nr:hypothetical protein [Oscillospiraceae bacterium]
MKYAKYPLLFCTGGTAYMTLELIWRGWSHSSMFLAGGTCFLLLGKINTLRLNAAAKALFGAIAITGVELTAGLLVNRDYAVWDYRQMPFSFLGQICLPFSLLWIPVGFAAMQLYRTLDRKL